LRGGINEELGAAVILICVTGISYPIVDGKIPMDSTSHPQLEDIEALKKGTNPKDTIYEAPKRRG